MGRVGRVKESCTSVVVPREVVYAAARQSGGADILESDSLSCALSSEWMPTIGLWTADD
jgi:hypothetical protein